MIFVIIETLDQRQLLQNDFSYYRDDGSTTTKLVPLTAGDVNI